MVDRKELAKKAKKFDGKKNVWVTDKKDGFIKGEIIGTKGEEVTVMLEDSGQVHNQFSSPKDSGQWIWFQKVLFPI